MTQKAIFLDRDGTLNYDPGYTYKVEDWQWLPEAVKGILTFNQAGWLVIVVSNQSGIARGYYSHGQLKILEDFVNADLKSKGAKIDAWFYCPHLPEITGPCQCRKPKPGLLLQAAKDLQINLSSSWMLGDKLSDVQAGLAAGCHSALISSDLKSLETQKCKELYPDVPIWQNLFAAATNILAKTTP